LGFKKLLNKKINANDRVINCSGKNLNTVANILSSSNIFLGNDSGPMHMATALGCKVLAIFGPSSKVTFSPAKYDKKNIAISADLECAPCNSTVCQLPGDKIYSCLTDLSVITVWENLKSELAKLKITNSVN